LEHKFNDEKNIIGKLRGCGHRWTEGMRWNELKDAPEVDKQQTTKLLLVVEIGGRAVAPEML